MSKPKYRWWEYAKSVANDHNYLTTTEPTATYERMEKAALEEAIKTLKELPDGELRYRFISNVYWRNKTTIKAAAENCGISEALGKEWNKAFLCLLGKFLGFLDVE